MPSVERSKDVTRSSDWSFSAQDDRSSVAFLEFTVCLSGKDVLCNGSGAGTDAPVGVLSVLASFFKSIDSPSFLGVISFRLFLLLDLENGLAFTVRSGVCLVGEVVALEVTPNSKGGGPFFAIVFRWPLFVTFRGGVGAQLSNSVDESSSGAVLRRALGFGVPLRAFDSRDFLGLPLPLFITGESSSPPFKGIVVVVVRPITFPAISVAPPPSTRSAWTVSRMRHGLSRSFLSSKVFVCNVPFFLAGGVVI